MGCPLWPPRTEALWTSLPPCKDTDIAVIRDLVHMLEHSVHIQLKAMCITTTHVNFLIKWLIKIRRLYISV
jgi:hypothetical protein